MSRIGGAIEMQGHMDQIEAGWKEALRSTFLQKVGAFIGFLLAPKKDRDEVLAVHRSLTSND